MVSDFYVDSSLIGVQYRLVSTAVRNSGRVVSAFKPLSVLSGRPLYRSFHPAVPCFENEAPAEGAAPAQGEEKPAEATLDDQLASIKKQLESSEKEVFSFFGFQFVA